MNRRAFLVSLGAALLAAGCAGGPEAVGSVYSSDVMARMSALAPEARGALELQDAAAARAALEAHAGLTEDALDAAIDRDFKEDDTVMVSRWILARTEALILACA